MGVVWSMQPLILRLASHEQPENKRDALNQGSVPHHLRSPRLAPSLHCCQKTKTLPRPCVVRTTSANLSPQSSTKHRVNISRLLINRLCHRADGQDVGNYSPTLISRHTGTQTVGPGIPKGRWMGRSTVGIMCRVGNRCQEYADAERSVIRRFHPNPGT